MNLDLQNDQTQSRIIPFYAPISLREYEEQQLEKAAMARAGSEQSPDQMELST